MISFFRNNKIVLTLLIFVSVFFVSVTVFAADGFIEPSAQAPQQNVVDFLNISSTQQSRYGLLKVGSSAQPQSVLDVQGNVYLQGITTFDSVSATNVTLRVDTNADAIQMGTTTANGKVSVLSTTGPAVYANSGHDNGIIAHTYAAGTSAAPAVSVFGQTTASGAGAVSYGVWGKTTGNDPSEAGVYGSHALCVDPASCASVYAGKFQGNLIVAQGKFQGIGSGVFRAWTLNDSRLAEPTGTGIATKTIDVALDAFAADSYVASDVLSSTDTFLSMQIVKVVDVDHVVPYDSAWATVNINDPNYLQARFDPTTQTLTLSKSANADFLSLTVQVFYHQSISMQIVDQSDAAINLDYALVGSSTITPYKGVIAGGAFAAGDFNWELHENATATDPCEGNECGTITPSVGQNISYTAPATMPTGKIVYLKASWTADPNIYDILRIDLYDVTFVNAPANAFLLIGGAAQPTGTFNYQVVLDYAATATVPGVTWTTNGYGSASQQSVVGSTYTVRYTSPVTLASSQGTSWDANVQANLTIGSKMFSKTSASFELLPPIEIVITDPASQSDGEIGTGKTVSLRASATLIPASLKHNFEWSITTPQLGESFSLVPPRTNLQQSDITYTAPTNYVIVAPEHIRYVRATWLENGVASKSYNTIQLYPGSGQVPATISATTATLPNNYTYSIFGYYNERKIHSICTAVDASGNCTGTNTVIGAVPTAAIPGITCGVVSVNANPALPNPDTCIPSIAGPCVTSAYINYTPAAAACSQTVYVFTKGDTRKASPLTLTTTGAVVGNCTRCGNPRWPCGTFYCADWCAACSVGDPGGPGET